jgi:hypothetical protein
MQIEHMMNISAARWNRNCSKIRAATIVDEPKQPARADAEAKAEGSVEQKRQFVMNSRKLGAQETPLVKAPGVQRSMRVCEPPANESAKTLIPANNKF